MPIYEYSCQDCKQIFEEWQKDYEEREIPCPVCSGRASRLISCTSFVLKGGGWYASGYSDSQGCPSASAGGNGGSQTAKPASSADAAKPAEKAEAACPAPAASSPATAS